MAHKKKTEKDSYKENLDATFQSIGKLSESLEEKGRKLKDFSASDSVGEKFTKRTSVYWTERQYDRLVKTARFMGLTTSNYLRMLAIQDIEKRGF